VAVSYRKTVFESESMDPVQPDTITNGRSGAWEEGRLLRLAGRPTEALKLLRQGVAAGTNDYRLHDEIGMALVALDRQEEAIGSFMTALRLKPDFDEACNKIGSAFASRGLLEPAAHWFSLAREINPSATKYLYSFGCVLSLLDRHQQAAEVFNHWVKTEPENPVARHLVSAALGSQSVTIASADYVRVLFDSGADQFDKQLAKLRYCGPELVVGALLQVAQPTSTGWDVLDAGCGTGLSGVALKPLARRLIGVDLSAGMLKLAKRRAIYDDLINCDIVDYLRTRGQEFDVVSAADVLTYIGDVSEFFAQAASVLRTGGLVAVATEALKTDGNYRLNPTGRFSHSQHYLRDIMERSGFAIKHMTDTAMRYESRRPVPTWVAVGLKLGS
jgi:predicted TPR repeat methyltransferase